MTHTEGLADWLRLMLTEGVGPQTARELLSHFGLPENIFGANYSALQKCVNEKLALTLSSAPDDPIREQIDTTLEWCKHPGNQVLTFADANYPSSLLTIADPPPVLYVKGRAELLNRKSIAMVGSRNATLQGIQNARRFAHVLSTAGLTVVSGLALGIDGAAHEGALSEITTEGSTIAVTGTGLDLVYPAKHRELAHQIAVHGCLVSEYPLGTPGIASNFPRRNRIISGLSQGVLVVEAAAQSGSLITARSALEQGRDVFAIPGSIHSPLSKGCHQLIRQGAKLVESAQDILEEIHVQNIPLKEKFSPPHVAINTAANSVNASALTNQLLHAAGHDPVSVDELAARTTMTMAEVQASLLELELEGRIERLASGMYQALH
ncbi:MAG: DNA-processing protein DprA [Polynucleobacter sp.]|nr:DNA-processing protein DprA [Polynucleobacter sp.]